MRDSMISRRRLLTAMALSPLLLKMGTARAAAINPHRIVALEWLPVELMLALGITPYGVADIPNYNLWVNEPKIPDSVIDIGLRTEPNLELLTQMKPSFLVWSAGYGPSADKLAHIAPSRGFTFSDGKKPLTMARNSLNEMAQLLDVEAVAKEHLDHFDKVIDALKPRFAHRGDRPLLMVTLLDARLDRYGIPNAWEGEMTFWGSTAIGIDRLAQFRDVDVLCFDHGNEREMQTLMATPLWQAMPFVRAQRFQRAPAVWFYGATLSAMHFARVLDGAIGGKA